VLIFMMKPPWLRTTSSTCVVGMETKGVLFAP